MTISQLIKENDVSAAVGWMTKKCCQSDGKAADQPIKDFALIMSDFDVLEGKGNEVDASLGKTDRANIDMINPSESQNMMQYSVSLLKEDAVKPLLTSSELLQPSIKTSADKNLFTTDIKNSVKKMTLGSEDMVGENAVSLEGLQGVKAEAAATNLKPFFGATQIENRELVQALGEETKTASIRNSEDLTLYSVIASGDKASETENNDLSLSVGVTSHAKPVKDEKSLLALGGKIKTAPIENPEDLTLHSALSSGDAASVTENDDLSLSEGVASNAKAAKDEKLLLAQSGATRSVPIRNSGDLTLRSALSSGDEASVTEKDDLSLSEVVASKVKAVKDEKFLLAQSGATRSVPTQNSGDLILQSVSVSDKAVSATINGVDLSLTEGDQNNAKLNNDGKSINSFESAKSMAEILSKTSTPPPQEKSVGQVVAPVGAGIKMIPLRQQTANLQMFPIEASATFSNIEFPSAGSGMQSQTGGAQTGAGTSGQAAMTPHQALAVALDVRQQGWTKALVNRVINTAQSGRTLTVNILPAHLGKITLKLSEGRRGTDLRIVADVPATASMLRDVQQQISSAFDSAGLTLGEYSAGTGKGGHEDSDPRESDVTELESEIENLSDTDLGSIGASILDDKSHINILL